MANTQTNGSKDSGLEEQRLEDALEHMNELHLQLRRLRSVLPRMLEPMASRQPSPQALHTSFLKSVNETSKEITSFKEAYTADKTKSIIQKADGSRRMNIKGIVPWVPSEHPDWTTPKAKRESGNQPSTGAGK